MTAKVTNPMSIVYGSLTFGSTSDYLIDGPISVRTDNATCTVSWRTVVKATTTANLYTAVAALESQMRTRFASLSVVVSSTTFLSFSHSSNTGFNAEPSAVKVGDPIDSGLTRAYDCSVTVQLPASDNSGRRWSNVNLSIGPNGQKILTVTGQYTAQSSNSARANYEANIDTYTAAIKTALSGTYEETLEEASTDDQNKLCDFRHVFEEIIYNQDASAADNASIKRHRVTFSRSYPGPGDTPLGGGVRRLQTVTASYTCEVDKRQTTDLHALWKNTIRPYILAQAQSIFQPGQTSIVEERPSFDKAASTFSGTLTMSMAIGSSTTVAYSATQEHNGDGGKILVPLWQGDALTYRVYQGPRAIFRTTTIQRTDLGLSSLANAAFVGSVMDGGSVESGPGEGMTGGDWNSSDGWVVMAYSRRPTPRRLGIVDLGQIIDVTDWDIRIVEQYVKKPSGGTGGPVTTPSGNPSGAGNTSPVVTNPGGSPGSSQPSPGGGGSPPQGDRSIGDGGPSGTQWY